MTEKTNEINNNFTNDKSDKVIIIIKNKLLILRKKFFFYTKTLLTLLFIAVFFATGLTTYKKMNNNKLLNKILEPKKRYNVEENINTIEEYQKEIFDLKNEIVTIKQSKDVKNKVIIFQTKLYNIEKKYGEINDLSDDFIELFKLTSEIPIITKEGIGYQQLIYDTLYQFPSNQDLLQMWKTIIIKDKQAELKKTELTLDNDYLKNIINYVENNIKIIIKDQNKTNINFHEVYKMINSKKYSETLLILSELEKQQYLSNSQELNELKQKLLYMEKFYKFIEEINKKITNAYN